MPETGEIKKKKQETDRNKRIKKEFRRINAFFESLNENEKSIVTPLIQNAAFMGVTLEDLQEIIAEQGPVEAYQNGANQYGMKQSAALQSYNSLVKNYATVLKNLATWLPPMERPKNPVEAFRAGREEEEAEDDSEILKKRNEELNRVAEYQRRQKELDDLIAKAKTQEERNRLINERNALSWH